MNKLVIFIHLHKTGGTTIYKHVRKFYPREEISYRLCKKEETEKFNKLTSAKLNKIKFLHGHDVFFGIDFKFKDKKSIYFTIIRPPEEYFVSFYNYLVSASKKDINFEDWYNKFQKNP